MNKTGMTWRGAILVFVITVIVLESIDVGIRATNIVVAFLAFWIYLLRSALMSLSDEVLRLERKFEELEGKQ